MGKSRLPAASNRDDETAATERYDVLVLPVTIEATSEASARRKFINAVMEKPSLVRVQLAALDIYVEGNDELG